MIRAFGDDIERLEQSSREFLRYETRVRHLQSQTDRLLGSDGWSGVDKEPSWLEEISTVAETGSRNTSFVGRRS
jgi:hypothetical protein